MSTTAPGVWGRYGSADIGSVAFTYLFDVDPPVQSILDQPHRRVLSSIASAPTLSVPAAQERRSSKYPTITAESFEVQCGVSSATRCYLQVTVTHLGLPVQVDRHATKHVRGYALRR